METMLGLSGGDYIAVGSLLLNVLVALVGGTWGISKINNNLRTVFQSELDAQRDSTKQSFDKLQDLVLEGERATERKIGEVGSALRSKIQEVELYSRDTFVRRETFQETTQLLASTMQTQFGRLEGAITRLSDKMDRIIERHGGPS